jgi:hypothetical protein
MNIATMLSLRMSYIVASLFLYGPAVSQDAQSTPSVETPVRVDP